MHRMKHAPVLDRRNFLVRAIQLAAATQLLHGCGGGGSENGDSGSEPPAGTGTTLDGQVALPAGLSLAGTNVSLVLGKSAVSASGAFQVPFIDGSIAQSQVRDAAGNLLVFGFLRAEQTTLSTRSTAEALVYRGLGLWAHAPRIRAAALALLRTEDLAAVEAAVVSAIASGGATWASSAKIGLSSAVNAKVATLIGPPPFGAAADKSVRLRGMIVTPTERVSGLIVEGDGIGACTVTNQFRRRALLVHTETAAKLESGPEYPLPENLVRTRMLPIDGLSSPLQAIADLFYERKSLYTPVSVSLATPRFPDTAVYTRYKVYGMGPGSAKGVWDELPDTLKPEGLKLILESALLDFVIPLLCSVVIFINAEKIDEFTKLTEASDGLKDVVNGLVVQPELQALVFSGDFAGYCKALTSYILSTDSVQIACTAALAAICETIWGPFVVDKKTGLAVFFEEFIHDAWSRIDKAFDTGEFAFTLFDSAIQALDIASSSLAETWDVTVTKAKVALTPREFFIEKNGLFSGITAVSVDANQVEGKVFGYRWKCSVGHLSAGDKYGPTIDSTTLNSVGYDAVGVAPGTVDQVEVDVFLSGLGTDDPVGSAKSKVYVTGVTVSPTEKKLKANESVMLTAEIVGMRPLAAGETVSYRWKVSTTSGVLTATDAATATFRADATKEGLSLVTVEAFLGEARIGTAQASLTVGDKLVVAGRVFEEHYKDDNCHAGILVGFPKIEGGFHYSVFVSGMRGPIFGTEYTWNVTVYPNGVIYPIGTRLVGNELAFGIGGSNGGGADCVNAPDQRWAAWYEGATVEVTVTVAV